MAFIVGDDDCFSDWPLLDMCVESLRADLVNYLEAPLSK
jgi:hypothetical protein